MNQKILHKLISGLAVVGGGKYSLMTPGLALLFVTASICPSWAKIGLGSKFGEVVVENVEPGVTYNLRELRQVPFIITNTGDASMDVSVEITIPKAGTVKDGYEAIPDPTWVKVIPDHMSIDPKKNGFCDIILQVPNDPKFAGRHYQANIWAHSGEKYQLGVGVMGRLRFSTGPGPESLKAEKLKKYMLTLDFQMTPDDIYVNDVPQGQKVDVKETTGKTIKVANFADNKLALRLTPKGWDDRFKLPDGYEPCPDPSWITFADDKVTVEGSAIGQGKLFVTVPPDEKYKGKKYAFLVQAGVVDGMDLEVYTRVFVSVKE
jgi:hypothetical protein